MLVTCTQCGVGFDHVMGRCIACGTVYAPREDERLALFTADAESWLRQRIKPAAAMRRLIDECGASEIEAQRGVQTARGTLRDESRRHGGYVATSGLILLLIALVVHLLTLGWIIATGCLTVGGSMVVLGGLKVVTGWNITGHDDE